MKSLKSTFFLGNLSVNSSKKTEKKVSKKDQDSSDEEEAMAEETENLDTAI